MTQKKAPVWRILPRAAWAVLFEVPGGSTPETTPPGLLLKALSPVPDVTRASRQRSEPMGSSSAGKDVCRKGLSSELSCA